MLQLIRIALPVIAFLLASTASASNLPDCPESGVFDNCKGKWKFDSGAIYDGGWREDKFHGRGSYIYPSGNEYYGDWVDGKKHGTGHIFWKDGGSFEGPFVNGERHGCGTRTEDGQHTNSCWRNGDYVGELMAERLTADQTRPYAKKCADTIDDLKGKYSFFNGIVLDETTHSGWYGDEARQAERKRATMEDFFAVLLQQKFRDVRGKEKYRIWACEFTINDGIQVVQFNPGCNAMFQVLPFVSEHKANHNGYEEYFFYRDQIIVTTEDCY